MYKFSHIGLMGLTLVLSGCGNDDVNFARLSFDRAVVDIDYRGRDDAIQQVYLDGLQQVFKAAGIAPEAVKIHLDEEKGDVTSLLLSTSLKDGITDAQKASIQSALKKIITDKSNGMDIRFTLRPSDMETEIKRHREEAARLNKEFNTRLIVKEVMVGISYDMREMMLSAMKGSTWSKGEAYCTVAMTVSPALPFSDIVVNHKEEKPVGMSLVRRQGYSGYALPTDIQLGYPHLQAKLDSHQILISTEITNSAPGAFQRRNRGMKQMEIELGSLGAVSHESGKVNFSTSHSLDKRCRDMAIELGRPFTFAMGDSLDRLKSFTFFKL
ncbi:hypothetical protein KCN56_14345 [Photobacterium galatheae]|uniref:Lipoprotein n=2 Tax=Photobacterium galatheae TaxID=1654360 RepID=A0A066RMT4_9GAMM|nr:hypothetical protein [Photobacterium galatheae]KDM91654.1 hypothetical protein EA58_11590 [Photobacterium galatheae]MCM0149728.1 hypothetical protein [Photobacterium galatheae]